MTWLDGILKQHDDFESPLNFWRWAGLAAISAVMKDSVYMDRYLYKLYPNIYVMFHADSGLKKGPPVAMADKLVKMVNNTTIIKGRSSIQAILKDMGTAQSMPGGRIKTDSSVFICSSELSSSIVEDPVAAKILTDLYDRHYNEGEWRSLLKQETFSLKSPTVVMLGATNEAMSEDFFTGAVIKGGYFARTFIIYESKRNKRNSLAYQPTHIPDYTEASKYLKELATLKGQFKYFSSLIADDYYNIKIKTDNNATHYFSEAGAIYHRWYDEFLDTVDSQEVKDETGTLNRFGDSVIKVAMLLSLAEHPKLEITPAAMNEAIKICEQLLGNVRKTTMGKSGTSISSNLKALIINELLNRENHMISRAMLTKKYYMHYGSTEELDHIMESFHVAKMIITETKENGTIYRMPEHQVKEIKDFISGKGNRKQ